MAQQHSSNPTSCRVWKAKCPCIHIHLNRRFHCSGCGWRLPVSTTALLIFGSMLVDLVGNSSSSSYRVTIFICGQQLSSSPLLVLFQVARYQSGGEKHNRQRTGLHRLNRSRDCCKGPKGVGWWNTKTIRWGAKMTRSIAVRVRSGFIDRKVVTTAFRSRAIAVPCWPFDAGWFNHSWFWVTLSYLICQIRDNTACCDRVNAAAQANMHQFFHISNSLFSCFGCPFLLSDPSINLDHSKHYHQRNVLIVFKRSLWKIPLPLQKWWRYRPISSIVLTVCAAVSNASQIAFVRPGHACTKNIHLLCAFPKFLGRNSKSRLSSRCI